MSPVEIETGHHNPMLTLSPQRPDYGNLKNVNQTFESGEIVHQLLAQLT